MLKICPQCRDEFKQTMSECPDCLVTLEFQDPSAPYVPRAEPTPQLESLVAIHRDRPWALEAAARLLQEAGVGSQIDAFPPGSSDGSNLAIYVEEANAETAREIVDAYTASRMPEHEGGEAGAVMAECPACSAPLAGDLSTCAECGLEFPELEVVCVACGQVSLSTAPRCGNCGQSFDEPQA